MGKNVQIFTPGRSVSPFPFNPFLVPPGLEPHVYVNHVVDLLADAYTLGDGSKSILQKALLSCYRNKKSAPAISDVLKTVEDYQTKNRATGWKVSATRALESLEFSKTVAQSADEQRAFAQTLLKRNTIVELDALSQNSKKFLVPLLCFWLYSVLLGQPLDI